MVGNNVFAHNDSTCMMREDASQVRFLGKSSCLPQIKIVSTLSNVKFEFVLDFCFPFFLVQM